MKINIITGAVRSGKTTFLQNFIRKNNCSGVLSPVINNERFFLNIISGELFSMEAAADEKNMLEIGIYKFSQNAFDKAEAIIYESRKNYKYLIIDEIGPLELNDLGFANVLKKLLNQKLNTELILVIRDTLKEKLCEKFDITKDINEINYR